MSNEVEQAGPQEAAAPGGEASGVAQAEQPSPERLRKARGVYRSYYRWLRWSRLAMAAFLTLAFAFFLWVLPWLPSGLDTNDYSPEAQFTVYLLYGVAAVGVLALLLRERAWRKREGLLAWSAVYDEATGLHHRSYLYDRLSLECDRAERSGGAFSMLILHIRLGSQQRGPLPALSTDALQRVAELINSLTHPGDLVALLSGSELAVLAMRADRVNRGPLLERLRTTVASELPRFLSKPAIVGVAAGAATYGVDGADPETLVKAARTSAALGSSLQAGAAS